MSENVKRWLVAVPVKKDQNGYGYATVVEAPDASSAAENCAGRVYVAAMEDVFVFDVRRRQAFDVAFIGRGSDEDAAS